MRENGYTKTELLNQTFMHLCEKDMSKTLLAEALFGKGKATSPNFSRLYRDVFQNKALFGEKLLPGRRGQRHFVSINWPSFLNEWKDKMISAVDTELVFFLYRDLLAKPEDSEAELCRTPKGWHKGIDWEKIISFVQRPDVRICFSFRKWNEINSFSQLFQKGDIFTMFSFMVFDLCFPDLPENARELFGYNYLRAYGNKKDLQGYKDFREEAMKIYFHSIHPALLRLMTEKIGTDEVKIVEAFVERGIFMPDFSPEEFERFLPQSKIIEILDYLFYFRQSALLVKIQHPVEVLQPENIIVGNQRKGGGGRGFISFSPRVSP